MVRKSNFRRIIPIAALFMLCFSLSLITHPLTIGHSSLAYTQDVANSNIYYLPHLNLGQGWQITINITNTACNGKHRRVNVTLTTYDKEGVSLGVITGVKRLRANKTKTINTQTLPPGTESLKIESNGNLICNAIFKTTDGKKSEVVPAIKEPSKQLDFPVLVSYDGLYIYKTITLLNPNTTPASVDIIALDKEGYEIDRNALPSLLAMESRTFSLVDIFGPRTLKDLSTVRINSDSNIIGLQLVDYPGVDLVGLPALASTSKGWTFPIATKGENFDLWTKVGILNPGNDIANFTVEAFDASNNSLGIIQSQTILPGVTYVINTVNIDTIEGDAIPLNAAILKVTSNQPVIGYEVIGILDGNGLAAAMGIPDEDKTIGRFEITGSTDGGVLSVYSMVRLGDGSVKSTAGSLGSEEWSDKVSVAVHKLESQEKTTELESNQLTQKKKVYLVPSIEDERMSLASGNWKLVCDGDGKREGNYQKEIAQKIKDIHSPLYEVKIFEGSDCHNGLYKCQSGIGKEANAWGADVLVSFHTNATDKVCCCNNETRKGTVTFYECEDTDKRFADTIRNAVIKSLESLRKNKGIISYDNKLVHWWTSGERGTNSKAECIERNKLRDCETEATDDDCDYPDWYTATMPACLIESLFHDNREESEILRSKEGQDAIAQGIANGIKNYYGDSSSCTDTVSSGQWKGEYYNNKVLSGSPSLVRNDGNGFIDFDWGSGSPNSFGDCRIGEDNFSVRWTRTVSFDASTYRFKVTCDDGFRLYIDGSSKLEKWIDQGSTEYTVDVPLSAGNHTITMEYYEAGGGAVAKLSWQAVSSTYPPPPITDLRATAECDGTRSQIRLNWTASSGATSYDIYRNYSLYFSNVTETQFINYGNITVGETYTYSVRAKNAYGSSVDSNIVSATAKDCSGSITQVERVTNGSFSSGTSGWTLSGDFWAGTNLFNYHTSPGYAAGGVDSSGTPKNDAYGSMYQSVTIPSNATSATISFWYNITTSNESGYDALYAVIKNSSGSHLATVATLSNADKGTLGIYSKKWLDVIII